MWGLHVLLWAHMSLFELTYPHWFTRSYVGLHVLLWAHISLFELHILIRSQVLMWVYTSYHGLTCPYFCSHVLIADTSLFFARLGYFSLLHSWRCIPDIAFISLYSELCILCIALILPHAHHFIPARLRLQHCVHVFIVFYPQHP